MTYGAGQHHRNYHKEKENSDQHVVDDLLGGQATGHYHYGLPKDLKAIKQLHTHVIRCSDTHGIRAGVAGDVQE